MKHRILYQTIRWITRLRYRIHLYGSECIPKQKKDHKTVGTLFLANHVSLLDPVLCEVVLWPLAEPRPAAAAYLFKVPPVLFLLKRVRAISVPAYSSNPSANKNVNIRATFDAIKDGLDRGENILFWPSGQLTSTGLENLGAASGAAIILEENPHCSVLLICTVGLWGSSFSKSCTGKTPTLGKQILKNFLLVLKHGIFFLKKKDIHVFIKDITEEIRRKQNKQEINAFLEEQYNKILQKSIS